MPAPTIIDVSTLDFTNVVSDRTAIEKLIPHRGNMLHIDAIVHVDREQHILVGYKDVRADEFWNAGHFPGYPILPGVIQCEAAAQMLAYYAAITNIFKGSLAGLGGLDKARFRGSVRPGDRLVIVTKGVRLDRRLTTFHAQGYVDNSMVFECDLLGMPIPGGERISAAASATSGT
jgi:3-hydroxyacyl-[acyl-carrier-protein] dehydratase